MQDHSTADQNYHSTASLILDLAKRAFDIFECSEILEKRSLINFVFQNMKLKDGKLVWDLKEPFNIIVDFADYPIWLPQTLDARTIVEACIAIDLRIIYIGKFPCWKDEVARIHKANAASPVSSQAGE